MPRNMKTVTRWKSDIEVSIGNISLDYPHPLKAMAFCWQELACKKLSEEWLGSRSVADRTDTSSTWC